MKRGQQKRIPTPGVQRRQHLFGAYDWQSDTITTMTAERKNSESFIAFLERLFVERFPTGHYALVLDNASYHTSQASLAALSLFEHRVLIVWLPVYCSTLNPIERFWRHLKDQVCVNTLYPHIDDLVASVEHQLVCQNDLDYHARFVFEKTLQ